MKQVAAYCRVSTDNENQVNSLESQKKYFSEYIDRNPLWELTEVYVDEGITGTSTTKRRAFNRMIADAQDKKFDLIITKEISRFARNTLDSIYYTQKLKGLGIGVIFMNDNINTLDPDAELRLTIMSSIAQEESRKTSERVKWGQKRRMEQGVVFGRDMLGYDVRNGRLIINESGAEIVRQIFQKYVYEEKGAYTIARELQEKKIQTPIHMKQWSNTVILRVLKNEKYCGDLIQKKTYTPSYLSHEKKYNKGEEEFVVIRNHHEPIISREMFEKAQKELEKRVIAMGKKSKHSSCYCFSGKIKCGECNSSFVSRTKKRKDKSIYHTWRCLEATQNGKKHSDINGQIIGCDNITIKDEALKEVMMSIIKKLNINEARIGQVILKTAETIFNENEVSPSKYSDKNNLEQLNQKKKALIELYTNGEISLDEFKEFKTKYESKISLLKISSEERAKKLDEVVSKDRWKEKEMGLKNLLSGNEWNDTFYRSIIEKIEVSRNILFVKLIIFEIPFEFYKAA
ncbi:MAG: recombinase family protein [Oscillospiraceae bacterium]